MADTARFAAAVQAVREDLDRLDREALEASQHCKRLQETLEGSAREQAKLQRTLAAVRTELAHEQGRSTDLACSLSIRSAAIRSAQDTGKALKASKDGRSPARVTSRVYPPAQGRLQAGVRTPPAREASAPSLRRALLTEWHGKERAASTQWTHCVCCPARVLAGRHLRCRLRRPASSGEARERVLQLGASLRCRRAADQAGQGKGEGVTASTRPASPAPGGAPRFAARPSYQNLASSMLCVRCTVHRRLWCWQRALVRGHTDSPSSGKTRVCARRRE